MHPWLRMHPFDIPVDKKQKLIASSVCVTALLLAAAWWLHDPFHGIGRHVLSDETIFYKPAPPLFNAPRRERTLFIKGISIDQLLAEMKKNYRESDGWTYQAEERDFSASKDAPGDEMPESIRAFDTLDGRLELHEVRRMSPSEVQLVSRTRGSDAFILFPGTPVRRVRPEGLDPSRFPMAN